MSSLLAAPANPLALSTLRALVNPRSIQSLAAGTLLGSCIWGSFISGVVAYKTLPRQVGPTHALTSSMETRNVVAIDYVRPPCSVRCPY